MSSAARNAAREAIKDTRPAGADAARSGDLVEADADADRDDLVIDEASLGSEDLLARELGAQMIEEIPQHNDPEPLRGAAAPAAST